jgi:hypothetical protein
LNNNRKPFFCPISRTSFAEEEEAGETGFAEASLIEMTGDNAQERGCALFFVTGSLKLLSGMLAIGEKY